MHKWPAVAALTSLFLCNSAEAFQSPPPEGRITVPATQLDDEVYAANADRWVRDHRAYEKIVIGRIIEQAFDADRNLDRVALTQELTRLQNDFHNREDLARSPKGYEAYSHEELRKTELMFDVAAEIPALKGLSAVARKLFDDEVYEQNKSQGAVAQVAARAQQTDIFAQSQLGDDRLWYRLKQKSNDLKPMASVLVSCLK